MSEGRFFSHARIYIHIQLANSNIVKTSDLSRKNLAEVESEVEVKYWIGGTTGETGFHSILFARFYPRRDPGRVPAGSLVQISSPAYTPEGNDIKELVFFVT